MNISIRADKLGSPGTKVAAMGRTEAISNSTLLALFESVFINNTVFVVHQQLEHLLAVHLKTILFK